MAEPLSRTKVLKKSLTDSGVTVHDFQAANPGEGAVFRIRVPSFARIIIARIKEPAIP